MGNGCNGCNADESIIRFIRSNICCQMNVPDALKRQLGMEVEVRGEE